MSEEKPPVFDAADLDWRTPATDPSKMTVLGAVVYGPPRSRWGKFKNRVRRLFGQDEQDEAYAYWQPPMYDDASTPHVDNP